MKLRKGQSVVHLPPISKLDDVQVLVNDTAVVLQFVSTETMAILVEKNISGFPMHCALYRQEGTAKARLRLHPRPDKSYELMIRYYPPMREL